MSVHRSAREKYTPEGEASLAKRWYVGGDPPRCEPSGHGRNGRGAREEFYAVYQDQDRAIRKDPSEIGKPGGGAV